MLLVAQCYPCILDDLKGALELLGVEEHLFHDIMIRAVRMLEAEGPARKYPSHYITEAHRILKKATGLETPFADLREKTNLVGIETAKKLRNDISGLPPSERFRTAVTWCVAANHLDFRTVGTGYGFDPDRIYSWLEHQVEKGLAVDMIDDFRRAAAGAKKITYVHDNVGEVAVDAVLIEELKSLGARVTGALRGGAITSDATMEDGKQAGLFEIADEVILAGPDTLGISLDEMTPELGSALREADLIVSKGQANYYVLTEYIRENPARIAFLFSNKCEPVAKTLELTGKNNIVWMNA